MPQPDFEIKRGDTSSALFLTLEDDAGDPVDIENAVLRFKLASIAGGELVIDDSATNLQVGDGSDGSLGDVMYPWTFQAVIPGVYLGEIEVAYASGDIQTFPNSGYLTVNVLEDLI